MLKPESPQPDPSYMNGPLRSLRRTPAGPDSPGDTRRPAAGDLLALRRVRYHLDLLEAGFRQALHPQFQVPSQRSERIALGIDRPELDTIPLWSSRRADGAIAIPFVDVVVSAIACDLEAGARAAALLDSGAARSRGGPRLVGALLQAVAGQRRDTLGRGEELFLPCGLLAQACGPDSPLGWLRSGAGRGRVAPGKGH